MMERMAEQAPTQVMGIVNVTPDSFSDGGRFAHVDAAISHGILLAAQGASIVDVGGESTRPGATPVPPPEECDRVVPVVRELAAHCAFCGYGDGLLALSLPDSFDHLRSEALVRQLANALAGPLGAAPQIRFESARASGSETLHARTERQRGERQAGAEADFLSDPVVSQLVSQGATVVPDSIRPLDDH